MEMKNKKALVQCNDCRQFLPHFMLTIKRQKLIFKGESNFHQTFVICAVCTKISHNSLISTGRSPCSGPSRELLEDPKKTVDFPLI